MGKARDKRVPPRRRPATQQDVDRAKKDATDFAIGYVWAVMFTVMRDKFGWGPVRLMRLWQEVIAMSDSIGEGYVKLEDLAQALDDEAGIVLQDFRFSTKKR
jgi:hypothetical protein